MPPDTYYTSATNGNFDKPAAFSNGTRNLLYIRKTQFDLIPLGRLNMDIR